MLSMCDCVSSSGYFKLLWIAEHRATSTDTQTISDTRRPDRHKSYSEHSDIHFIPVSLALSTTSARRNEANGLLNSLCIENRVVCCRDKALSTMLLRPRLTLMIPILKTSIVCTKMETFSETREEFLLYFVSLWYPNNIDAYGSFWRG